MFFKKKITFVLLLTSMAFGQVACSEFINGKKKNQEVIELSAARFVCLQDVPNAMKMYTAGESEDADLKKTTDCLQMAFSYFKERTRGSVENGYTPEDMRKFFGKYFLKQNNISSELAANIMKLKQAVIGGSSYVLSKDEIDQFISFLNIVRDEAISLRPYIKILFLQEQKQVQVEDIQKASNQLKKSLLVILGKTQLAKSDYTFTDTKNLLSGMADFITGDEQYSLYANMHSWIPLADSVKVILMGERANLHGSQEWSDCLHTVVSLYDLLLKHHYVLKDLQVHSGIELRLVSQVLHQALELVLNSYQLRTDGRIPFEQIDNLIDRLNEKSVIQFAISPATIKDSYRKVLLNILDPVRRGDSRGLHAVEMVHLLSLQREFNIWRLNQIFVDSLKFDSKAEISLAQLRQAAREFQPDRLTTYLSPDEIEKDALKKAWSDFQSLLYTPHPMNFDSQGRVLITYEANALQYNWHSVTQLNLMHTLTRAMLLGYGDHDSTALRQSNITEEQISKWYEDFNLLGLEIKAFDPRSGNSGPRSFKEANFFTFSGNGDDKMNFNETYELVSFMISGGLSSSESLRKEMLSSGCAIQKLDVFGLPLLKENCFRATLKNKFDLLFHNMPGLVASVASMNTNQWFEFYGELMGAARVSSPTDGFIETADIRTMVMLLHYSESLLVTFDLNQSGGLSLGEVNKAAPRFLNFLRPLSPIQNDAFVKDIFAYLVFKGHRPTATDYAYFQGEKFAQWIGASKMEEAHRVQILRVFRNLKEELKNSKKQAVITR